MSAAAPSTESELTTIDSLPAEILNEVLLRVPTPASLVHAAAACRSWRGAIADTDFLARYRERHRSSPLLGLYVPRQVAGPPSFQMADSIRLAADDDAARDLNHAALRASDFGETRRYRLHDDDAFILGRLRIHPDCRVVDCHNSRLLLARGDEALEVRSPLSRESILLPFPPDAVHPGHLQACLLPGHATAPLAAAALRVVYLEHRREGRRNWQARAVEYDSSKKRWQDHPWETIKTNIEGTPERLMHAGHRIFCTYRGSTSAALLLNTSNLQFSVFPLPSNKNFAIGEIEDNVCCFVESVGCLDHRLRVWQLDEERLEWELKKNLKMDQVLGEHVVGYYRPGAISNGMALLCSTSKTTHHHFAVDLSTCSMKEMFEFHGQSAYLMQMPWPPAFSGPTANELSRASSDSLPTVAVAAGLPRVDGDRSYEEVLSRITREVESSGKIDKDLLPPFSQDIQQTIRTKTLALPETSFQLLKGVDPWIASMTPQSQLEHNVTEQCDNDQSLRSSHKCVNIEKPVFPTENAKVQQETMANVIKESEKGNLQKGPSQLTSVLQQPCASESRSYIPPQEDTMDAVGLGAMSPEKSPTVVGKMSVGTVLASAGCDAPLQGSITDPFSQQAKHGHTATVEPKSCRKKSPNLPDCADGEGSDDCGSSNQSSKVSSHEGPSAHATLTPDFGRTSDVLPTNASEPGHFPEFITAQDTTMSSQPDSRKDRPSALQHERGEKVNQDLEDVSASIRPVEKDHIHHDQTLQSSSVLLPTSCNGANQGSKSERNLQPGTATENRMAFEEKNADRSHLEVGGAIKANQALHDDGSIMKNNTVQGGLTAQTAPVSQNCNVTFHDKTSEANCFSEQKNEKNRTDVQKGNCRTSIPSSSKDRDGECAKKTSNEEKSRDTSPEICVRSNDQGLSQRDLCIKCDKAGQLLKCNSCHVAAHDRCISWSVIFEETNLFYCPLCFYKKATEAYKKAWKTYCEASNNLKGFIGETQAGNPHDEQLTGVQTGAAKRDVHLNGSDMLRRNSIHQNEAYDLAHRDEEPHQPRKKQKINATGNGYPKEVITEKVPFQNCGPASMNKHSVLQNNNKTRVGDPEKTQQAGDKEARKEAGNDNPSHEKRASSPKRCDPPSNEDVEADQEDGLTASNQSGGSDELEATFYNGNGKGPSPPWCNMGHSKKRLQEKDQHKPTSRRKIGSNPLEPGRRRTKLSWTAAEEAMLREAMAKFNPQDGEQIPWVQIRQYGNGVFHKTRQPPDLRVKWRIMKKKELAGY